MIMQNDLLFRYKDSLDKKIVLTLLIDIGVVTARFLIMVRQMGDQP